MLAWVGGAVVATLIEAICVVGRIIVRRVARAVTAPTAVRAAVARTLPGVVVGSHGEPYLLG
ncbi:hypothetical protein ACUY3R_06430 [Corynebacterium sp. 23_3061]